MKLEDIMLAKLEEIVPRLVRSTYEYIQHDDILSALDNEATCLFISNLLTSVLASTCGTLVHNLCEEEGRHELYNIMIKQIYHSLDKDKFKELKREH